MGTNNSIILGGEYRKLQSMAAAAGQTPLPGMLLKQASASTLTVHATQGGYAERIIALEDSLQGKTKSDAYVAGNIINAIMPMPGTETQVLLSASSAAVVIDDQLVSQGDGKFEKIDTADHPLCVATEALDLTASGSADTLINVRWL